MDDRLPPRPAGGRAPALAETLTFIDDAVAPEERTGPSEGLLAQRVTAVRCQVRRVSILPQAMSSSHRYQALNCNLCWKELKEPFIVTSCNHCFCMEHEHDDRIKQSTCPGCGQHLPSKGGLNVARYRIDKDECHSLNGLQPDALFELASNAVNFWVSQERTRAEYKEHQSQLFEKRKEDQKEQFRKLHAEMSQEITALRQSQEDSQRRNDELKHELTLLEEKYKEEAHKCERVAPERMTRPIP
jgi:hypothetical protein